MTSLPGEPLKKWPSKRDEYEAEILKSGTPAQKAFVKVWQQRNAQEQLAGERTARKIAETPIPDTLVDPPVGGVIYNPARPFPARAGFWEAIEDVRKIRDESPEHAEKIDSVINSMVAEEQALLADPPENSPGFLEGLQLRFQAAMTAPFKYDSKGMPQYSDDPVKKTGQLALAALNMADIGTTILAPFKSFTGLLGAASAFGKDNLIYSAVGETVRQILPGKGSRVGVLPGEVPVGAGQARFGSDILEDVFGWEDDQTQPSIVRALAEIATELTVFGMVKGVGHGLQRSGWNIQRAHTARDAVNNVVSELNAMGDAAAAGRVAVAVERFKDGRLAWDEVIKATKAEIKAANTPLAKQWDEVLSNPLIKDVSRWDMKTGTYETIASGQVAWGPTTDIFTKQLVVRLPAYVAHKFGWKWPLQFLKKYDGRTLLPAFVAKGQTSLMGRLQSMWQGGFERAGLVSTPNRGQAVRMADVLGDDTAAAAFRKVLASETPEGKKIREAWKRIVGELDLKDTQGLLGRTDVVESYLGLGKMPEVAQFDLIRESMAGRIRAEQALERIVAPLNAKVGPVLKRLDDLDANLRAAIQGGAPEEELALIRSQIYQANRVKDHIINSPRLEKFFQQNPEFRFMVTAPVTTDTMTRIPLAGEKVAPARRIVGQTSGKTFVAGEGQSVPTTASESRSVVWSPAVARERIFGGMARLTGDEKVMERWASRMVELNGAIENPIAVFTRGQQGKFEFWAGGFARRAGLPEEVIAWKNAAEAAGAHHIEEAIETLQDLNDKFGRLPKDAQQIVTDAYNLSMNKLRLAGPNAPTPDKIDLLRNLSHRATNAIKRYVEDPQVTAEGMKNISRLLAMPGGRLTEDVLIKGLGGRIDQLTFERFQKGVVQSGGRRWIRPARSVKAGDEIVFVKASELDKAWRETENIVHVGPKGKGGSPNKYDRFISWLKKDMLNEMPEIAVGDHGQIAFRNGRHRFAVIRDSDPNAVIPVAVPKGTRRVPGEVERMGIPSLTGNPINDRKMFEQWMGEQRLVSGQPSVKLPVEFHLRGSKDPSGQPGKWQQGDYSVNLLGPAGIQEASAKQALAELMDEMRGAADEVNAIRNQIIRNGTPEAQRFISEFDDYLEQLHRKEIALGSVSAPGSPSFTEVDAQGRKMIVAEYGRKAKYAELFQDSNGSMLTPGDIDAKLMAGGPLPYDLVKEIEENPDLLRRFRYQGSNATFLFSEDPIARTLGRTLQLKNAKTAADVMDATFENLAWRVPVTGLTRQHTTASIAELMAHFKDPAIVERVGKSRLRVLDIDGALDARNRNPRAQIYVMDRQIANSIDESVQTAWDMTASHFRAGADSNALTRTFSALNRSFKTTVTFAPGFHSRNFLQGVLVNYLVGTNPTDVLLAAAAKITPNRVVTTATGPVRLKDLVKEYVESGASKSLFSTVVPSGTMESDLASAKRMLLPSKDRRAARALSGQGIQRWVSQRVEDSIRFPAYVHFRRMGLGKVYAANQVNKYFFDYGNMTHFERNVVSAFVPWYPWFRNVIGFTLKEAVQNPTTLIRYSGAIGAGKNLARAIAKETLFPWGRDERGEMVTREWANENPPLELIQFFRNGELMAGEKVWIDFDSNPKSATYGDLYYMDFGTGLAYLNQFQQFSQALQDLTGNGQGEDIGASTLMGMLGPIPQMIGQRLGINPRRVGMPLSGEGKMGSFLQLRLEEKPTAEPQTAKQWPEKDVEAALARGIPRVMLQVRDRVQAFLDYQREKPLSGMVVNEPVARAFLPWGRLFHELTDRDRSWTAYGYQALGLTPSKINIFREDESYTEAMEEKINTLLGQADRERLYRREGGRLQFFVGKEDLDKFSFGPEAKQATLQLMQYNEMWKAWHDSFKARHPRDKRPETVRVNR